MATFLLVIIFVLYIGLGLPDSSIGASWPALYVDLGLNVGTQSLVAIVVSLGTVGASFFSARIINKFGTILVTSFSTLLSALALLGFSLSNSLAWLIVFAIPLGFGAGAIDAAINNYVATKYKASHVSFVHCCYGIGVALTPYLFSLALFPDNDWRLGFRIIFIIQMAIAVVAFASIPLWKKVEDKQTPSEKFTPVTLSVKQMAKMPTVVIAFLLFFSTCSLEFLCGTWGCTFLVKTKFITESYAASLITFYYVGITSGRFISGIFSKKLTCGQTLTIGFSLVLIGVVALFFNLSATLFGIAFFLIGFGNGPTFPLITHATPFIYGKEKSQSIIGIQMVGCNLGILSMCAISGPLFQLASFYAFPYYAIICYILMISMFVIYQKLIKKQSMSFYKIY